jgi:hypothetical protein
MKLLLFPHSHLCEQLNSVRAIRREHRQATASACGQAAPT